MHAHIRRKFKPSVANSLEAFLQMSSWKPHSSERVPRTLTDGTLTEREQNRTEQIENGYGTSMERIWNGYGTDTEQIRERERECVWNGYRTRSVKRSLLGVFWLVLYINIQAWL